MNSYKYILLATDFSKPATIAAHRAAEIAAFSNARLCLLHVIEHFPEDIPNDWIAPEDKDPASYLIEHSTQSLETLASQLEYDNIEIRVLLSEHSVTHEITHFAEQNQANLIVTGHQGRHGMANIFSSTTSAVMHRAICDVLSVQ